jgi:hypothetical protein
MREVLHLAAATQPVLSSKRFEAELENFLSVRPSKSTGPVMFQSDIAPNVASQLTPNASAPILSYGTKRATLLGVITTLVRSHKKLTATAAAIVILVSAWFGSPSLRGSVAAHIDVARGRYEIQTFGLPAPWSRQYTRLLYDRYGVRSRPVAGCVVSGTQVSYVDAYDSVVADAAIRRFGHDIFAECAADAVKAFEKDVATQAKAGE